MKSNLKHIDLPIAELADWCIAGFSAAVALGLLVRWFPVLTLWYVALVCLAVLLLALLNQYATMPARAGIVALLLALGAILL